MFKKKQQAESKKGSVYIAINEGLYKTKSNDIVRLTNIEAYFDTTNGLDIKSIISSDMMRSVLIQRCYDFTLNEIIDSKERFVTVICDELNTLVKPSGINCIGFAVEQISKVDTSVR